MSKHETKNIMESLKKPELYLGIATLIVVSFFVVKAAYKPVFKIAISPTPSAIVKKPSITPKIEAKKDIKKDIKQITKFADTGTEKVVVKEGDNYWTLAEQVCGEGSFAGNGEELIQPGDILTISCE